MWKPIDSAPENCTILAKDEDGNERNTWKQDSTWMYEDWISLYDEDTEEYEDTEEIYIEASWNPIEWFAEDAEVK